MKMQKNTAICPYFNPLVL